MNSTQYGPKLEKGQKVRFNGKTNIINDRIYSGQVGTVEFKHFDSDLYYIAIRAPGQRKDRSVSMHRESLEVVA